MKKATIVFLLLVTPFFIGAQEICENGIDDDFDGLIDLLDTADCSCDSISFSSLNYFLPNPSFEDTLCCPDTFSLMSCAQHWQQASAATSDYFNLCGFDSLPPVNMVNSRPLPLPDGNGFIGFYNISGFFPGSGIKEYVGVCLTNPMLAGKSYTLSFYMAQGTGRLAVPISLFGTPNCANIPFGGASFNYGCPTNGPGWEELKTDTVTVSNSFWTQVSFTFIPTQTINAIVIGPDCDTVTFTNDYHYLDNFLLTESSTFSANITLDSGHFCQNNLRLKVNYDSVPNHIQWYRNGIALINDTNDLYQVPPAVTGYYQARIMYDSGCAISDTFFVDSISISANIFTEGGCLDLQVPGSVLVRNLSGGTLPYSFSLDNAVSVLDSNFLTVSPGNHLVTILDSNLCSRTYNTAVDTFPEPIVNFISDTVCLNDTTHLVDLSSISSGTFLRRVWSLPGFPTTQLFSYKFPSDGVYPINLLVESDSGCINDTTINVIVRELPNAQFSFSPTEVFLFDTKVCFSNLSNGNTTNLWDFGFIGTGSTSILNSPCTVTFPNSVSGAYRVKLVVENQYGCLDSVLQDVIIKDGLILYIPNSFSPNEDGLNDLFLVQADGIDEIDLKIFNRWGELLFSSTDVLEGWDGKHLGELVPIGVYIYTIKYRSLNRKVFEKFGHINLLK